MAEPAPRDPPGRKSSLWMLRTLTTAITQITMDAAFMNRSTGPNRHMTSRRSRRLRFLFVPTHLLICPVGQLGGLTALRRSPCGCVQLLVICARFCIGWVVHSAIAISRYRPMRSVAVTQRSGTNPRAACSGANSNRTAPPIFPAGYISEQLLQLSIYSLAYASCACEIPRGRHHIGSARRAIDWRPLPEAVQERIYVALFRLLKLSRAITWHAYSTSLEQADIQSTLAPMSRLISRCDLRTGIFNEKAEHHTGQRALCDPDGCSLILLRG